MKVACFSVAALDYFPNIDKHYPGGNALNQALRFRRMGHESAFVGALGTDEAGDRIYALLRAASVDVSRAHRVEGRTASNRLVNDEAGERYGVEGAWDSGVYGDYDFDEADWAFLARFEAWATHANHRDYEASLERKPSSTRMAVDFLHLKDYELLERSLEVVDIAYFGGTADMADELARVARRRRGVIVLTLGAEGSMAFAGDRVFEQAALPIEKVVDTTGCGDAFQAGFTASFLAARDIPAALLAGAELGRTAARSHGGAPWD
jgi:fructoselysine 6-kinase